MEVTSSYVNFSLEKLDQNIRSLFWRFINGSKAFFIEMVDVVTNEITILLSGINEVYAMFINWTVEINDYSKYILFLLI